MSIYKYSLAIVITLTLFAAEADYYDGVGEDFQSGSSSSHRGVGQYGYPSDPMSDRAKGYLLKGKVKNAVSNWGDFINWYVTPAGLWGEYSYLPDVAMIAGIPGHVYSSSYQDWEQSDMLTHYSDWYSEYGDDLEVWCSEDLYDEWDLNTELLSTQDTEAQDNGFILTHRPNGKFIGIVFDTAEDIVKNIKGINSQAINSDIMPPGNITGITEVERNILKTWIEKGGNINN